MGARTHRSPAITSRATRLGSVMRGRERLACFAVCLIGIGLMHVGCDASSESTPAAPDWRPAASTVPSGSGVAPAESVPASASPTAEPLPGSGEAAASFREVERELSAARPAFLHRAETEAQHRIWRDGARSALGELMSYRRGPAGWQPEPASMEPRANVDDVGIFELAYEVEPEVSVVAALYLPPGDGPHPGVVFWHGHAEGAWHAANLADPEAGYHRAAPLRLAKDGYAVLVPAIRTLGNVRTRGLVRHIQAANALHGIGESMLARYVADAEVATAVLGAVAVVDEERIAAAGVSIGGWIALVSAALDDRIRAVVVAGYLGELRALWMRTWHCPCQLAPGLLELFDIADVAALIAPRPILFVHGSEDAEFPVDVAEAAFARVRAAYRVAGSDGGASLALHDGGHEWRHEPVATFLGSALSGR